MKRVHQEQGERDWAFEDLRELQSEPLKAVDSIFSSFGDCVISGCNVVGNTISSGMVSIGGKVMPFEGATNVTFPCKLVASVEEIIGKYVDNGDKPISYNYKAVVAAEGDGIEVTASGATNILRRGSDAVDSDSSATFATSKAVAAVNTKLGELAGKELLKSDAIDLEDSETLATSMAVAAAVKHLDSKIIDTSLPVNTILTTTAEAGNIFGDKWLKCDGSSVYMVDYPLIALKTKYEKIEVTKVSMTPNSSLSRLQKVLNGIHIAIGTYETNNNCELHFSRNLRSWTRIVMNISSATINDMIYVEGKYYICGSVWAGVKVSTDLITWNTSISGGGDVYNKMCYHDGKFGLATELSIKYTSDFISILNATLPTSVASERWQSINYCNGLWMAGSQNNVIIVSPDLVEWTQYNIPSPPNNRIYDFCYFNSIWFAATDRGVMASLNGITDWNYIEKPKLSGKRFKIHNNRLFCGYYFTNDGDVWQEMVGWDFNNCDIFEDNIALFSNYNNAEWVVYKSTNTIDNFTKQLPTIANSYIKALK